MIIFLNYSIGFLGLIFPGYALARLLRLSQSWAASFPLSALILVESVILFSSTGIPIRFSTMAIALIAWTTLFSSLNVLSRPKLPDAPQRCEEAHLSPLFIKACLCIALVIIVAVTFRTTLYPLSGYDTFWRWDALARDILFHESLSFYPPVTASDYAIYPFTDGIPPLVSAVYWWIYATIGTPIAQATSASVLLQLVSALALTAHATRQLSCLRAAYFSLLAFLSSTLLIYGFAIGQETGFITLSVAGQICFGWATVRNPRISSVFATALFAALGALARDYGLALALTGFFVLIWHAPTRKYLPFFIAMTVTLSIPWYLRNWFLTGNPLYSHVILGSFPVNSIHAAIMESYKEFRSLSGLDISELSSLIKELLLGAPIGLLIGVPFGFTRWREYTPLLLIFFLIVLLWLSSVSQTSGGSIFSIRVFAPAIIPLSVLVGVAGDHLFTYTGKPAPFLKTALLAAMLLCTGYTVVFSLSHPFSPDEIRSAITYAHSGAPEFCAGMQELADKLQQSDLPATGVLTDNTYLATILQRETRFRPVMIWSPEVKFVFDSNFAMEEIRQRLYSNNIRIVSLEGGSVNKLYLSHSPFYKSFSEENTDIRLIITVGNKFLYYLRPSNNEN